MLGAFDETLPGGGDHRQDHQSGVAENRNYSVRAANAVEKQRWKQMVAF